RRWVFCVFSNLPFQLLFRHVRGDFVPLRIQNETAIKWLSDMDSNHDKCLQRALCYHYTIGQAATKLAAGSRVRKAAIAAPIVPGTYRRRRLTVPLRCARASARCRELTFS